MKKFCMICGVFFLLTVYGIAQEQKQARTFLDVVYKTSDGVGLTLNLFLPAAAESKDNIPLLIWLDSGCWYSKKPGGGGFWKSVKALEKGFAVASVRHRNLGDGYVFPAQIEDIRAAIRYLRAHAKEYGLDPNRFAVSGGSSGGHLACMSGIADKTFDVGDNLEFSGQANCVIDFFGPAAAHIYLLDLPFRMPDCLFLVLGAKKINNEPLINQASRLMESAKKYAPYTYVDKNYAPVLILHGVADKVVPISQSVLFYEKLQKAGVRSQLYVSNTGKHNISTLGSLPDLEKIVFDFLQWKP
ncbi:MAG: alpha/beta hydrolase [Planctomycetia bacterium]|nr:alpha/beta hydrolase [Planctomycetia bacterium]